MLSLRADYAKKQSCNYSVFVSFPYNAFYIQLIKTLPDRTWIPESKEWEVGQNSYQQLMNLIESHNLSYIVYLNIFHNLNLLWAEARLN